MADKSKAVDVPLKTFKSSLKVSKSHAKTGSVPATNMPKLPNLTLKRPTLAMPTRAHGSKPVKEPKRPTLAMPTRAHVATSPTKNIDSGSKPVKEPLKNMSKLPDA